MTEENQNKSYGKKQGGFGKGPHGRYIDPSELKIKNFKKTLGNLVKYLGNFIIYIVLAIIAAILGILLELIGPSKLSDLTNLIESGLKTSIDLQAVFDIGIFLLVLYLFAGFFTMLQGFLMATVTAKMSKNMRGDIVKKINKLPIKFFDKTTTGDILSRITNDVDTLSHSLNHSLTSLFVSFIKLVGSLFLMIKMNVYMALSAIFSVFLGFIVVFIIMKISQKHFANQQKYLGEINGHIEEAFSGHTVVKAYNGEEEMLKKFSNLNETLRKNAFMAESLSGIVMPIIHFIDNLGYVVVAIIGAVLVMNGSIEFGVIVAFFVLVRYFTQPLTQISGLVQRLQVAIASVERVFEFLNERQQEDEKDKEKNNKFKKGMIEFKNVNFGYDEKTIINNLNFKINAGDKIAIVGPTGAGKTTIVNLLMRFYEINSGNIYIDGVDSKEMTREYIHKLFCMVLQDSWIFEGTIKENIIFNNENVGDKDVIEASKAVGLHHFVTTLPNGYDTILDESINLSVGQKQQLTIARAIVSNAPMLILDEATSSIDTRTEKYIQDAMDKLMQKRTSFIIAHRLSTIKNADLILVLKDGDIIESGNHKELMKKDGFYKELYNSQFVES